MSGFSESFVYTFERRLERALNIVYERGGMSRKEMQELENDVRCLFRELYEQAREKS